MGRDGSRTGMTRPSLLTAASVAIWKMLQQTLRKYQQILRDSLLLRLISSSSGGRGQVTRRSSHHPSSTSPSSYSPSQMQLPVLCYSCRKPNAWGLIRLASIEASPLSKPGTMTWACLIRTWEVLRGSRQRALGFRIPHHGDL